MRQIQPDTQPPPTPRWVKMIAFTALVLFIVAVAIVLVTGDHGPGRHGTQSVTAGADARARHA